MQSHAAPNKNSRWIRGVPYKHDPHVYGARGKLTSSNQWKFAGPVQTAWVPYEKFPTVLNNRRLVLDVATFAHARCDCVRLSLTNYEEVPTNAIIPSRYYLEPFQRPTWIIGSRTQPKPNWKKRLESQTFPFTSGGTSRFHKVKHFHSPDRIFEHTMLTQSNNL